MIFVARAAISTAANPWAVEDKAIDHRFVGRETKQARARIAGLRQRRHRTDLGKAEAERKRCFNRLAVLVEAGGKADRIGKIEAKRLHREARIVGFRRAERQPGQRPDRNPMRGLGIEAEHQRPRGGVEAGDQALSIDRDGQTP